MSPCPGVEIGRQATLRVLCAYARASSNLVPGTLSGTLIGLAVFSAGPFLFLGIICGLKTMVVRLVIYRFCKVVIAWP